ncbi:MAG: glycosyltransferase family 39 protein [Candidatus Omnitrophica bacterium]|nr:glycosyltransferase family 39 protein [Candidatus Omnitrophota bacterium]
MKPIIDKYIWILVVIFLFYASVHIYLYSINSKFHTIDAPNHALFCLEFYRDLGSTLKNPNLDLTSKLKKCYTYFREGIIYWPKFVYLTSIPPMFLFGPSINSIKYANLLYVFILMLYTYLLVCELTGDKMNSLFISSAVLLFPVIFEAVQGYGLDFPLTALTVIFYYYLIKTDLFTKLNYSIYTGLILGISFLVKGQISIFIFSSVVWIALRGMIKSLKDKDIEKFFWMLVNICIFVVLSYGIASIWWNNKFSDIWISFKEHTISNTKYLESHPLEEYKSLSYYGFYLKYLFKEGIGPILFGIILFLNILFYLRKDFKNKFVYFLWLVIPLIAFSFLFQVKQLRFVMPVVPAMVICAGSIFAHGRRWKYMGWSIIMGVLFIQLVHPPFIIRQPFNQLFSQKINIRQWKSGALNKKIVQACVNSLGKELSPGRYKVIIFKYLPLPDGPVAFQFWIELLGYKKGYYFYTHDFVDQAYSVYYWLKDRTEDDKFLFVFLDKGYVRFEEFFTRDIILSRMQGLVPWIQEYENNDAFLEMIEVLLPNIKKNLKYISEFQYLDYKGEVYRL